MLIFGVFAGLKPYITISEDLCGHSLLPKAHLAQLTELALALKYGQSHDR